MIRRRTYAWALLGASIAALVMVLVGIWLGGHPGDLPSPLRGGLFETRGTQPVTEQALGILTTRYYRPLDRANLVDVGLAAMVASLDDRYSHYVDPRAYKESTERSDRHLTGVGIEITSEPQGLRVTNVFADSPAAAAGLMRGDLIIKIGSTSLAGQAHDVGPNLLTGPAGTHVTLTFLRDEMEHVVSVGRATIVVPVAQARMLRNHEVRIGYLRLTGFREDAGAELRSETDRMLHQGAQALILDLRGNGGGLISEAVKVASIFIPSGTILSAVERNQPRRVYEANGDAIGEHIPMVVLVDQGTASSAEIVTAALQDHGRAKVVGTDTYGKGVFQITERLSNGGALDLTIGQFFTPDGRNVGGGGSQQGTGITPDVYASNNPDSQADEALAVAERTVAAELR